MSENFIKELPKKFTRNVLDLCGEKGEQWLSDLPLIIGEIEEKWALKAKKHFPHLSYNYVAPCICADGSDEAVLKIALPLNNPEIFNEAEYLQAADGKGAVKLLKLDKSRRAILLEKLTPGKNLKEIYQGDVSQTIDIAIKVLHRLLNESSNKTKFLRLEDWFNDLFVKAEKTKFPRKTQAKAREFYEKLSLAQKRKFLIHGDLHHENILSAKREPFLAIDPKGIIGDIGYEIAVFLNNHLWWLSKSSNLMEKLDEAVQNFSESFEIEQNDLRKWAFAQIVLSAWWTFDENGENWERELAFTEFWKV